MDIDLTFIWAMLLATAVFLYVAMDGFDLGVGILFAVVKKKQDRDVMVNSVAPFWDGNETWLVLGGGGLLAVFPMAYAIIMPAFYMPIILMLLALVFRGVSFEMRFRAETTRHQLWWDRAFSYGSYVAALCQGITLGALVQGVKVANRAYAGGWWDWLTPFSILTGIAVIIGYGLLGACWLIWKTEGDLQKHAQKWALRLGLGTLVAIGIVSIIMPFLQPEFFKRWFTFPNILYASPIPLMVAILAWIFISALKADQKSRFSHDAIPFLCALGFFLLSYIGLGISMWPHIVPPDITFWDAAASESSQKFLLVGALVLIPTILSYTGYVYWLFRGKVTAESGYH